MAERWLEEEITIAQIEALTGKKVKSLTKGWIETGEFYDTLLEGGGIGKIPVTSKGIEIEFEIKPTVEKLALLDPRLVGFKRVGGKSIADEMADLKAEVAELKAKIRVGEIK